MFTIYIDHAFHIDSRKIVVATREEAMIEFATGLHGLLSAGQRGIITAFEGTASGRLIQHFEVTGGHANNEMTVIRHKN